MKLIQMRIIKLEKYYLIIKLNNVINIHNFLLRKIFIYEEQ